jgi:hypothetical protein
VVFVFFLFLLLAVAVGFRILVRLAPSSRPF